MGDALERLRALRDDPEAFKEFESGFDKALDKAEAKQAEREAQANATPAQKVDLERGKLLAQLEALQIDPKVQSQERSDILAKLRVLTPEHNQYLGMVHKPALDFD
jgi:hypothetical protein